ncbi:hypothetical protein [Aquabacterium sp. J223]|uniref:hypothetical protein n=1 Tax=Aquabacterium sp. J223 TaxID=2898431 RepID=UPI0021AE0911|nr:hypothetical protein [Aquabacterium sp. J223]UUX94035.1 hypothetical protein LRS07_11800 [Aquabacterium sp. J223]
MPHHPLSTRVLLAFGVAAAGLLTSGAAAAQSDVQQRYQAERAACLEGRSQQDRATCLREAGAAAQAARQGQLATDPAAERNRTARCERVPAEERSACLARLERGTVSGSVAEGGVLREYREIVPAAPSPSSTAPAATGPSTAR